MYTNLFPLANIVMHLIHPYVWWKNTMLWHPLSSMYCFLTISLKRCVKGLIGLFTIPSLISSIASNRSCVSKLPSYSQSTSLWIVFLGWKDRFSVNILVNLFMSIIVSIKEKCDEGQKVRPLLSTDISPSVKAQFNCTLVYLLSWYIIYYSTRLCI